MDIEKCTVQRLMAEKVLDGHKVSSLFIEMSGISVTKSMRCNRKSASDPFEVISDIETACVLHDMGIRLRAGKKPSLGLSVDSPVIGKNPKSFF